MVSVSILNTGKPHIWLDPRSKMALLFATGFIALNVIPLAVEIGFFLFLTLLLVNGRQTQTAIKMLLIFSALVLLDGFVLPMAGGVLGVILSIIVRMMRIYLPIGLAFMLVVKTTTVSEFIAAFYKMRVTPKIVIPFSVMFRFVPTVKEEWQSIRNAMKFRGIGVNVWNVLLRPMMTLEYVLVPLLMSASKISNELAAASLARGLDSEKERTCITRVFFGEADYIILLLSLALVVCAGLGWQLP